MGEAGKRRLAAIMAVDMVAYSRLMEVDEDGTLARQKAHRRELIDPAIARHGGHVVKSTGDGALAEFPSAVEAVRCAVEMQQGITACEIDVPMGRRIEYRIGVHVGDIVAEEGDIYGYGVNVAARLETLAEPGSVYISQQAYDQVEAREDIVCRFIGEQAIKNIVRPVRVYRVALDAPAGVPARTAQGDSQAPGDAFGGTPQEVRFCRSADGTMIAYACAGSGPPVVRAAHWMTHLDYDWGTPSRGPLYAALAREHLFVRHDQRGNGLSDRDVSDLSLDAHVRDLEAVVDAAGLAQFALFGTSQGGAISIAYAAEHPDRVTHLLLHGASAKGWRVRGNPKEIKRREAMLSLIEAGWGTDNAAFHQVFTSLFLPDANAEQIKWFVELQRNSASPKTAVLLQEAAGRFDVLELLPQIKAPTLVTHSRYDSVAPFEWGRKLASLIPGARFVALESRNHVILPQEPEWPRFINEIRAFLSQPSTGRA